MHQELPRQSWKWTPVFAIAGAFVLAVLLFLLIPFTQLISSQEEPDLTVREVLVLSAPPPTPPPPPEEPVPPEPKEIQTEMPPDPRPVIEVEPLDLVLSPGSSEAIAMGAAPPALRLERDTIADIEKLFTFDDLPEAPRLINAPNFRFPATLVRQGVTQGEVLVEIDILPDGTARLRRILSASHRALEPVAREIVERARFTKPMIDGQPQTVRGRFPLVLQN